MIKVSHEVPLELLEESKQFNDYDYALVHLFEVYPEYLNFYKNAVSEGRRVFLDNSCFELGASVDNEVLIKGVKDLQPTHVIAPDFLDNKDKTIEATDRFVKQLGETEYKGEVIYVIQGKTYQEYVECYKIYQELYNPTWIAFPFDIKCFKTEAEASGKINTKTQIYAQARNILLDKMIEDGVIDYNISHHLLGCSDPVEYKYYTETPEKKEKFKFISSVDTSCPIILAMFAEELPEKDLGKEKRTEKLADNLHYTFNEGIKQLMYKNIATFKTSYLGRNVRCEAEGELK